MFFTVGISLYTSRVVLVNLGVSDFGLYNVVGGVVSMLYMVSGALSGSVSRFLTFEIGREDKVKLREVFSMSLNIQFLLSFAILILAETIGLWFLNRQMNIEASRMYAANWIYQVAVISFILELLTVPYNSLIIAHERMKTFAYITVLNVILKLTLALVLVISPIDKLIFYSIGFLLISLVSQSIYFFYCKIHFNETNYKFTKDKEQFKVMFSFAGWNFLNSSTSMLSTQGLNILLNIFLIEGNGTSP